MRKSDIYMYTASQAANDEDVLNDVQAFITRHGGKPAQKTSEITHKLKYIIRTDGEEALKDFMKNVHPDREQIIEAAEIIAPKATEEKKLNCDGCGGGCGKKLSFDAGFEERFMKKETKEVTNNHPNDNTGLLIFATISVVTLALIFKNK